MFSILSKQLLGLRNRHFLLIDSAIFLITPFLALFLRLDGAIDLSVYQSGLLEVSLVFLVLKLGVLHAFGFYRRCWKYAGIEELQQMAIATIAAILLQSLAFTGLQQSLLQNLPRSLPLLDGILSFLLVAGFHFSIPTADRLAHRSRAFFRRDRVLIVGAGSAGVALVKEMQRNPSLGLRPVAFIDDNPAKLNLRIRHLPVVGDRHSIPEVVRSLHIRKAIIAMPTVQGSVIREILDICQKAGVQTSTLPGIHEILNGRVSLGKVREVQIEDLLRREPIQMDTQQVSELIQGKRIMITGAGGSIGSELCRQLLKFSPSELVLIGHGENSVFNIQQELEKVAGNPNAQNIPRISTFIADIRFLSRLESAFDQFRPNIIFHAAAHKHVPLMEANSPEAITNNVQGTKNLLDLSLRYGVDNFVMISTDKAVNPTNIMGASKRVAEMLVLQAARKSKKRYVAVRFGNVLGSRGSVIPTFKRQIAEGGPVTVTHPEVCRYFMTIPEAVQLVLQAGAIGQGGEVFMLDMGNPVKIVDLAEELIRLSGYEVGKTMEVVFTGLRPGEKLFEELFLPGEQYDATQHEKLLIVTNATRIVPEKLDSIVEALCRAALRNEPNEIIFLLEQVVPGFKPQYNLAPVEVNRKPESAMSLQWSYLSTP
ncbi:polysaccharide biosynthesis protein [Geitlerinema calcuttense]|uniref:Nucleoside-diphosphate sugar epimerase/dehydratase n=1 Tax=Geitlerinema calcuttense NRMC-F 0142 TaxID=2922238 RepID=A0ABT7LYI1_9CYAN|nr:nucleoside-diphosphate sugar epimerase/dehydratase [Geitlerinema calcuttense]MDL5057067.1 nucleoside-diphosphate sugar epimerase/dehydratase [Geitlerinema calcuttense NRMC-F 0142]